MVCQLKGAVKITIGYFYFRSLFCLSGEMVDNFLMAMLDLFHFACFAMMSAISVCSGDIVLRGLLLA